jgi:hypothetical protein
VLIRNPYDSFISQFNIALTLNHTTKIANKFWIEFKEEWEWFVGE